MAVFPATSLLAEPVSSARIFGPERYRFSLATDCSCIKHASSKSLKLPASPSQIGTPSFVRLPDPPLAAIFCQGRTLDRLVPGSICSRALRGLRYHAGSDVVRAVAGVHKLTDVSQQGGFVCYGTANGAI